MFHFSSDLTVVSEGKMIDFSRPKIGIFDQIVQRGLLVLGLLEEIVDNGLQTLLGSAALFDIQLE